jgi:dCMP deaminase
MNLAQTVATRSKDPNTNVGAVLVNEENSIIETGYNGFAPGVEENFQRWQRPLKYLYVIHAEQNAIGRAARFGKKTDGSSLYVTHFPCRECAKMIIAAGVKNVFAKEFAQMTDESDVAFVKKIFKEAGVVSTIVQ